MVCYPDRSQPADGDGSASLRPLPLGLRFERGFCVNDQIDNQHALLERILLEAGGQPVAPVAPAGYTGKIADILFAADDVVVEIKSLTTDRAADPVVGEAVGDMFARNTHLGAPVVFGTVTIGLHDLNPRVAANALRILGKRVQAEAKAASAQLKATKAALGRPNALGVIALISPPFKLDRKSIAWTMGDAMRDGRCSSIDVLLLVETPLAGPADPAAVGNSFLSLHSRDGTRLLPPHLVEAIDEAWGRVTGQPGHRVDSDDFAKYGATS